MNILEYQHVSKAFGKKLVLNDINLSLPKGKIIGLLGKNGMGKSTLIKLANGLLVPTAGTVLVNGQPIGVESKRLISYLPERSYLDKNLTIKQTIHFFAEFYDDFDSAKAHATIQDLGLDANMHIAQLSKGMQEKLQLALVMSRQAKLYILDEPIGGVDPATRDYILDTILSNFDKDASILISTHLIADVEHILDQVIFIDQGKITLTADADRLRAKNHASIDEIFRKTFRPNINQH